MHIRIALIIALAAASVAHSQSSLVERANELIGPLPQAASIEPDVAGLGERLFNDPRLSGDNSMSCATCHLADGAFIDEKPSAIGAQGKTLPRNTPTLLNIGIRKVFAWDGRGATLEAQSLEPIADPNEMSQDLDALATELNAVNEYRDSFDEVFGGPATVERIGKALAAYQRTLVTRDSPFDRFLTGDENALSPLAKDGLELFLGDSECVTCHSGPLLSDGKFYRLGIGGGDKGRGNITGNREDDYRFRVPTLRNVARTAPYMHDGSIETLFEVVTFYFRHSAATGQEGLPLDFEPLLGQSYSEIEAIVAFLESLTDDSIDGAPEAADRTKT